MMPGIGVTVLSEVAVRLMMIFGAGALTCPTKCGGAAFSRLTKVTQPPSRRGHRRRRRAPETAPIEVNQAAFGWPHSKLVPSTQIQWRMIAILRAIATFAFFMPIRLISRTPHAFRVDHFLVRCTRTLAASNK